MNSSKNHSFLKENEKRETPTPECSHNQTNIRYLNNNKKNNTIKKGKGCFYPHEQASRKWMKKQPPLKQVMSCFSNHIKITVYHKVDKKPKHQNHQLHRVCTVHNTPPHYDPNKSKNTKNNHTTFLSPIKQYYHTDHSISTLNNRLTGLTWFIIHLFILYLLLYILLLYITLLYIYSFLFISLLLYILYYLSLFLEEKNKISKILENLHILKNIRRPVYDD